VYNRYESQIDTGEMMKNLIGYCSQLGIQVLNGIGVTALNESDSSVNIETSDGITFTGKQVAVCTNAFTRTLLPDLQLKPGRGMVLITEPIPDLPIKGTFHYDEGFYYFRDYNERIIFGGGRNIDFETETTTDFEINTQIKTKLIELLDEVILPDTNYKIHHEWTGIMAFGETKEPIVKKHSDRISVGVRMGGMGVAIGSMIGEQLAEMLLSEM
jgi:gamma-glutamylputrescine oxidase